MTPVRLLRREATDLGCFGDSNLMRLLLEKQPPLARV